MKNKVITAQYQRLDYTARNFIFPAEEHNLVPKWEHQLREPDRTWIKLYEDKAILIAAPHSSSLITAKGLDNAVNFPVFQVYRGVESEPSVVDDQGNIYRWKVGSIPVLCMQTDVYSAALTPVGFPENHLFVAEKRKGLQAMLHWKKTWTTKFVNCDKKKTEWSYNEFPNTWMPGPEGLFLNYGMASGDLLYYRIDGSQIWKCVLHAPVSEIIGYVNDTVWIRTRDGTICSIAVATGKVKHTLKIILANNPMSTMDEQGRIVICNGVSITVIDAAQSGAIVSQKEIQILNGERSSTVHGNEVLLTRDEHIIYADYHNRIFRVPLFSDGPGFFLWQATDRVRGITIAEEQLVILYGTSIAGLGSKEMA